MGRWGARDLIDHGGDRALVAEGRGPVGGPPVIRGAGATAPPDRMGVEEGCDGHSQGRCNMGEGQRRRGGESGERATAKGEGTFVPRKSAVWRNGAPPPALDASHLPPPARTGQHPTTHGLMGRGRSRPGTRSLRR